MYRDLARNESDWEWLRQHHVRYDITVIPARTLCGEYVKTKGHYHTENPAGAPYPGDLRGAFGDRAFLLQTRNADDVVMIDSRYRS